MSEPAETAQIVYGTAPVPDYFRGTSREWDALWAAQRAERRKEAAMSGNDDARRELGLALADLYDAIGGERP